MLGYFLQHASEYLLLLLIFIGGLLSLFLLEDRQLKMVVAFALTGLYLLWAIWHHWEQGNLKRSTLLEYLVIAGVTLWVLLSVL